MYNGLDTLTDWTPEREDEKEIAKHMDAILTILLGDKWKTDENLKDTPKRYARMMSELTVGIHEPQFKFTSFDKAKYSGMILVRKIPFFSLCAHHLLPFFGEAYVGYIPKEKIVGLSKIPRLVQYCASKFQIQEQLSDEIADALREQLAPQGVIVVIKARHLCMEMRGVKSLGDETITSSIRGCLAEQDAREEALLLLKVE